MLRLRLLLLCVLFAVPASAYASEAIRIDPSLIAEGLTAADLAAGEMQIPAVVNPSGFDFDPSPDHSAVGNGGPLVTKYTLDVTTVAAPTVVVKTIDLGKPPVVAGKVAFTGFAAIAATLPVGDYVAVVKAEGPGGTAASVASDPFTVKVRPPAAPGKPVWKQ